MRVSHDVLRPLIQSWGAPLRHSVARGCSTCLSSLPLNVGSHQVGLPRSSRQCDMLQSSREYAARSSPGSLAEMPVNLRPARAAKASKAIVNLRCETKTIVSCSPGCYATSRTAGVRPRYAIWTVPTIVPEDRVVVRHVQTPRWS